MASKISLWFVLIVSTSWGIINFEACLVQGSASTSLRTCHSVTILQKVTRNVRINGCCLCACTAFTLERSRRGAVAVLLVLVETSLCA